MDHNSFTNIESNFNNLKIGNQKCDSTDSKEQISALTSVQKYVKEWETLFSGNEQKWKHVCECAKLGGLRTSYFRSICWRMMLSILPAQDPRRWSATISQHRLDYENLKKKHYICPRNEDASVNADHPLSQDAEQSKWHKYFCDNELKAVIKQDVIRTFPGVEFFQDPQIQEHMLNILFSYARKNPEMCYRQGMHEILAPILFVLNFDIENFFSVREIEELSEIISQLMNPDYLEHDSYRVMESMEMYYKTSGVIPTSSGYFPPRNEQNSPLNENHVITRLSFIKESILKPVDADLDSHLTNLQIPFSAFGIRWLRLLFGREFEFEDLLVLWDVLFSEGADLALTNFVVVALLLKIRYHLLRSDYSECLALLMQYPHNVNVIEVIRLAIDLRDASMSEKGLCPMFRSTAPTIALSDQTQNQTGARRKENSRIRHAPRPQPPPISSRRSVIDGIAFNRNNKTKNLLGELSHMQMVLTICKDKLAQYHKVLDPVVSPTNVSARQAVEGLFQLHLLLDDYSARMGPKPIERSPPANEIETASEAGEGPSMLTGPTTPVGKFPNKKDGYERELKELSSSLSCTTDEAQQADPGSVHKFPSANPISSR